MKVIIERFEGAFAVVELLDKTMANIPRLLLPDAKEGDVISIEVDPECTALRKENTKKLMKDIWE